MAESANSGILPESIRLDVEYVASRILLLFPGAYVLDKDPYARERERALSSIAALRKQGAPIKDPERILNDIENKRAFFGVAKSIRIPTGAGDVTVNVQERSLRFYIKSTFDEETRNTISSLSQELGLQLLPRDY